MNANSHDMECPISKLLTLAGAKWTVEVMRELAVQPTRTRQFLRRIPGLSMKSLQERLHQLEAAKLIIRKDYGTLPKKVEFFITDHGLKLLAIMADIKRLSNEIHNSDGRCVCPFELATSDGDAGHKVEPQPFQCPVRKESNDIVT